MNDPILYSEKLSSPRTTALFGGLTLLCSALCAWRAGAAGLDWLAGIFLFLAALFFFYTLNYRTLHIQLTEQALTLRFGIFTWVVPRENIESCALDALPPLMEYGGAGIHFMMVRGRYRASFNFLEYPRLVVAFKKKVGPVCDISFSTRRPQELLQRLP